MADNQLAAKLHLIPLTCYINGKTFEMGGVSSVATWPEFRRQGAVKDLLYHALQYMRESGQAISFLHPFSFAFYRKYGWEHTFSEKVYTIPLETLKQDWKTEGSVHRIKDDTALLHDIYTDYAGNFNGPLTRDEKWWEQRVLKAKWHKAAAFNADGEAEGYLLYKVNQGKVIVHEFVYNTLNARKLLMQFIANHDSMADTVEMTVPENDNLPLLVEEPRFEQKIKPYFMARIVDVEAFLKDYPFNNRTSGSVAFRVEDAFLPENNGIYQLAHTGRDSNIVHVQSDVAPDNTVYCPVQQLAAMLMGYKRPTELSDAGLIQGPTAAIEQLETIIPYQQPFFPDFY